MKPLDCKCNNNCCKTDNVSVDWDNLPDIIKAMLGDDIWMKKPKKKKRCKKNGEK